MKILVLSCAFSQPYYNARLRSQCDLLIQQGHSVDVYTELWDGINFKHKYPIHELGKRNTKYLKWLFLSIYSLFTNYKERKFASQVIWHSRKDKYDVVFCSTNSCFPLGAASMVAKLKGLPLHIDLWDIEELSPNYVHYRWWQIFRALRQRIYTSRRNRALRRANSITTVSPAHVELLQTFNSEVSLLYNGYDPTRFFYEPANTDFFRINYIGYAYESQRIDTMLRVYENLKDELPKIQLTFYSEDLAYNHFKYSSPNVCGILPEVLVPDTMHQSAIILQVNDTEDNGLETESFYQAVGAERPILFIGGDEGAIPDMIRLTHTGIATQHVEEAMEFIRELYHQWEQDGYTHIQVQQKDLFNAQLQIQQLEDILSQTIPNK